MTTIAATVVAPPGIGPGSPPSGQAPASGQAAPMILDKYKDQAAFDQGFRELAKIAAGPDAIKPDAVLMGDNGMYKTQDQMVAAYKAMSTVLSNRGKYEPRNAPAASPQAAPATAPPASPNAPLTIGGDPGAEPEPEDVIGIVAKSGLKMDDVIKSYTETGDLTDEQYAAIRGVRKNLGKADIKLIADGMAARAQAQAASQLAIRTELATIAGSAEQLSTILKDVKGMVTPAEEAAYNKLLSDPLTAAPAFKVLMQVRKDKMGAGQSVNMTIPSGGTSGTNETPLTDQRAISAAMNDKRYSPTLKNGVPNPDHDPAYRMSVLNRIQKGSQG